MNETSPDPFFRPEADFARQSLADDCPTFPQAPTGGFCGVRIQPDCLRIDSNGVVRVSLSATARTWFEALAQLGEALHLTRNRVAVLGGLNPMPVVENWQNAVLPRDRSGRFAPNLAEYASLWAVREDSPMGVLYGLEARDVSGAVFDRVLLPLGAPRELFEQFVTAHQSPPEEAGTWFPPNHAWSAGRRASLAGRIPWLRQRWASGDQNIRRLPASFVPKLLAASARATLQLRTTHYHPALMRTVLWTPEGCAETPQSEGALEFFPGERVALHLNQESIASVWLWMGECSCCAEQRWSVEIADVRDHIGLALMAGEAADESDWRSLIQSVLR